MLIVVKNLDDVVGLKALSSQEFDMKDLGAAKKILLGWKFTRIDTQRNYSYPSKVMLRRY